VIAARDKGFSEPVLYDLLQLVHRRSTEAAPTRAWDALRPYVSDGAARQLGDLHAGVRGVSDVVLGGTTIVRVRLGASHEELVVRLRDTRREALSEGERHVYVEEVWTFRRAAGATSPPPDVLRRMGCPSCGNAVETDAMGRCRSCETPIVDGRLVWQAVDVTFPIGRRPLTPEDVAPLPAGDEPSVHWPTRLDPRLGSETRALLARHPDFVPKAFEQHVRDVFIELQAAWSAGQWERARPYVTDACFASLRFWIEAHNRDGRRNRVEDVRVDRVQVVRVRLDAWYESITVRLWAGARDWTEDASGRVIGGNRDQERRFSEYWTFVRTAGKGGTSGADVHHCPSCAAPLDRVSQAGVCGYCETKITTGDHDWVSSRIDQTEVYA
jgi:predicted lipid-binding transport protein (Tim44 family)